jgi:hypothetical protein
MESVSWYYRNFTWYHKQVAHLKEGKLALHLKSSLLVRVRMLEAQSIWTLQCAWGMIACFCSLPLHASGNPWHNDSLPTSRGSSGSFVDDQRRSLVFYILQIYLNDLLFLYAFWFMWVGTIYIQSGRFGRPYGGRGWGNAPLKFPCPPFGRQNGIAGRPMGVGGGAVGAALSVL